MSGAPATRTVQQLIEICIKSANESSAQLKKLSDAASTMRRFGFDDLAAFKADMDAFPEPADMGTAADFNTWALAAAALDLERRRKVNFGITVLGAAAVAVEEVIGGGA